MNTKIQKRGHRALALLMAAMTALSLLPSTALAAQPTVYRDPAEHWMSAGSRTNELDANAVITHETFLCQICGQYTSFTVWRTPEYTRDGKSALTRNVLYSDGTTVDGNGTGSILDGTPGVDATYTGYHWTKSMCDTCGTINANGGTSHYGFGKNVYNLYDCAVGFTEYLDDVVTCEPADATYHTKTVEGGHYCEFCFGTVHTHNTTLERHDLTTEIKPQLDNQRFAIVKTCKDCGYSETEYVAAKAVVANYYGAVDGKAHTLTVSDLSESGVNTKIRYGTSADTCTLTTPPSYTDEGEYTVYYEIAYTYQGTSMTQNGAAYVWLHDEKAKEPDHHSSTEIVNHTVNVDGNSPVHQYAYLDTVAPTCTTLGYDRYLCSVCGAIEKRNYTEPVGHTYQTIVIREADCEHEGKTMEVCRSCGEVKETVTPKGEHQYKTSVVPATCTAPGYTVKECDVCGDRIITNITTVKPHSFKAVVNPATCTTGGFTTHTCANCGESYVSDYTDPTGHKWDNGSVIAKPSCTGEGVKEYTCLNCGEKRSETIPATGHTHGDPATCTDPETCTACGAVLEKAHGHDFTATVTKPTCLSMGYTTYTCGNCYETYKSDYKDALGHNFNAAVTAPTCTEKGYTIYTCTNCDENYVDNYTNALGHDWDKGTKITDASCKGEGVLEHHCSRCDATYIEAISPKGHNPGPAATCTEPQLCQDCGAVLKPATGHSYKAEVTAPTCTEMGFTTYVCSACGDTYKADYTNPTGHKHSDWIVDREPTMDSEGLRHKVCENCGETVFSEPIEKLYRTATTNAKGEAVVNGYLLIVTDTASKDPVPNATVTWNEDGTLSVRLPDGRLLDYGKDTTVNVYLAKDKTPVQKVEIKVTDQNGNYAPDTTDKDGRATVPREAGKSGNEGSITIGGKDADAEPFTITVKVVDGRNDRPIDNASVTVGKTGTITVVLPDGLDMDEKNPIVITVTDQNGKPITDRVIVVKGDKDKESGKTNEDGTVTLPVTDETERHGVYIYGYPDGTFGPARSMTRSEAAAIFARLLAEKNGDTMATHAMTKFTDVPTNIWYSGYVKYLTNYGVIFGTGGDKFSPDRAITRAEFVAMAVRFFEAYGDGNAEIMAQYAEFSDVSSGYWAAEYIKDAAIHGWIKGYGDGTFQADRNIARSEVVTIVNRLLDRVADQDYVDNNLRTLNTFTDMKKDHWAYYEVMESANAHTAHLNGSETWSK